MKNMLLLSALLLGSCKQQPTYEKQIIGFMKENANDPSSYEPISFRFVGPSTLDNTGAVAGDNMRTGDLYAHTYRAKNGFGAQMVHTTVFALEGGAVKPLSDSLSERAINNFIP